MPFTHRNYRKAPDRPSPGSHLGWWIGGTFVLAIVAALVVYEVTRPNKTSVNSGSTQIAPQANTTVVPKTSDRVQNLGSPATNR